MYPNQIAKVNGKFKIWAYNSAAAQLLNKRLKQYPPEIDFVSEASEGVFVIEDAELAYAKQVCLKFGGLEPVQDPLP